MVGGFGFVDVVVGRDFDGPLEWAVKAFFGEVAGAGVRLFGQPGDFDLVFLDCELEVLFGHAGEGDEDGHFVGGEVNVGRRNGSSTEWKCEWGIHESCCVLGLVLLILPVWLMELQRQFAIMER